MNKRKSISFYGLAGAIFLLLLTPLSSFSQENSGQESEVYLTFEYRGVLNVYLATYYKDGHFYLPAGEVFNVLGIDHTVNQEEMSIAGMYLGEKEYLIDFEDRRARAGDRSIKFRIEDYLIKELDYFLKLDIFNRLFDLKFTVDFNNLTLDLETLDNMPVVARYEREQRRQRLDRSMPVYDRSYYPLKYDRSFGALDGGFLDYNLTTIYTPESRLLNFNNAIGAEILGGDLQGSSFGIISDQQRSFATQNLRWRFAKRNNPYFSSFIAGQTNSEGISSRSITGFKISNKPVEARLLFDQYVIDGDVPPQSEVELYLNNTLVDYQETDASGMYRFVVPLSYGSTDYSVRVYTPSGQSLQRSRRIQIPFNYVPPGRIDYSISGGRLESPILGSVERGYVGQASLSAGLSEWLTLKASSEYLSNFHTDLPSFTGTLNARLFSNYLISLNANSEDFYRLTSSVIYSSGVSWSLEYDYNPGNSRLYNIGGSKHRARANLFTPVTLGAVPLNIRWSSSFQQRGTARLIRYRADLNTRFGRLNTRLSYQDQQSGDLAFATTRSSRVTNSYTYTFSRGGGTPYFLKGTFVRGQLSYLPGLEEIEEIRTQISRDIARKGSIQLSYGRNFIGGFNTFSLNLTIDFNKVRSTTSARAIRSSYTASQNFRGSIGYDPLERQLLLNNRQQVGQAGAAFRLFLDNNNDGSYQSGKDELISDPAVRLNRSGGRITVKGGINYISQLLPYQRYDIEINKAALSNPLMVPEIEKFSIVTDPNQYKPIEIPFYLSGVISGRVERMQEDSTRTGLSGVRLNLETQNNQNNPASRVHNEEIRTYSDGSFYTYEVPPGEYDLYIDHTQLEFLNAVSKPDTLEFRVRSRAQGDFIEGLTFTVIPKPEVQQDPLLSQKLEAYQGYEYYVQIGSYLQKANALRAKNNAEKKFGTEFLIAYNKANSLYGVRTKTFSDRQEALSVLFGVINSQYGSALVLTDEQKKISQRLQKTEYYAVQLGAFSSKSSAEVFALRSAKKLGLDTEIQYDENRKLYKVFVASDLQTATRQAISRELHQIQQYQEYANAFMTKRTATAEISPSSLPLTIDYYTVQLGAFSAKKHAEVFARQSEEKLGRDTEIHYDEKRNLYKVYISVDPASATRKSIGSELRQIHRYPEYRNTFMTRRTISLTQDDAINQIEESTFTYEIHIQGVTPQSEQAFLSSILDGTEDQANLDQPSEDLIIFRNIESWEKAVELKEKLSQISSIGKPVIVLIKNPKE